MLEWTHHDKLPMYFAKSAASPFGEFRIFYDDIMYWDTFSNLTPTQDLDRIKEVAQSIHDEVPFNQETT
jgi:hypothetical protein